MGIKGREMSFTKEDKSEMVGRNFKEKGRGEKNGLRSADYWIPSPSGTTGRVASERKGANKNLDGASPKSPVLSRTRLVYPSGPLLLLLCSGWTTTTLSSLYVF